MKGIHTHTHTYNTHTRTHTHTHIHTHTHTYTHTHTHTHTHTLNDDYRIPPGLCPPRHKNDDEPSELDFDSIGRSSSHLCEGKRITCGISMPAVLLDAVMHQPVVVCEDNNWLCKKHWFSLDLLKALLVANLLHVEDVLKLFHIFSFNVACNFMKIQCNFYPLSS